jgi:hypothetical protein
LFAAQGRAKTKETCLMFQDHLLDVFLQEKCLPYIVLERYSRMMQHQTTEGGGSRIRNFGQIMFQDHLLDVFFLEKCLSYLVF